MTFFTANDFRLPDISNEMAAAEQANAKLEREAKVVYSDDGIEFRTSDTDRFDEFKGLLICIEKIKKECVEHKPKWFGAFENECVTCGKRLKPTGWRVCDD